jgi:hypothetical protein
MLSDIERLQEGFEALAKSLTEFGYSGVTADQVKLAHDHWKAGDAPKGIIESFAFDDFVKYPAIFGAPTNG